MYLDGEAGADHCQPDIFQGVVLGALQNHLIQVALGPVLGVGTDLEGGAELGRLRKATKEQKPVL